jgi:hypothetical protein
MIGVQADSSEHAVIAEFFELFKTPWEFCREGRRYDVLLCAGNQDLNGKSAQLVLIYAGHKLPFDTQEKIGIASRKSSCVLAYKGARIPIYGNCIAFQEKGTGLLVDEESRRPAINRQQTAGKTAMRIGYDLFGEIGTLLTVGQPAAFAGIPTLELHIAFMRELIVASGVPLVEIPPVPDGYSFIACLTHDVDHPSIRRHKLDHTTLGFFYRAVFASMGNFLRGQMPARTLLANWGAALKLPFVHLGWARDFWRGFVDRYLEVEKGLSSTFFVIPFENDPGRNADGPAPAFRASRYGAEDIADLIREMTAAGCEVGLHGIDAWRDNAKAHEELEEIGRITGSATTGVRMHWLYYAEQSPLILEQAGAVYDSTVGYRETVGYRAGTTQAYKPLKATRLLELPMQVMDTALFYPAYLGLTSRQAKSLLERMVDTAAEFGGCMTTNWHDRSLAPERMWDACYRDMLADLKSRGAWFATAGRAASWFQMRRSVVFETEGADPGAGGCRITAPGADSAPRLRLRVHNARESCEPRPQPSEGYVDIPFDRSVNAPAPCGASR